MMNTAHDNVKLSTLADRALLVRLSISRWNPYAYDDKATLLVEMSNNVHKVGRFNKHLMKESTRLSETNGAFNAVYNYHTANTVPWLDDGMRMLASEHYFEYTQGIQPLITAANVAAQNLQTHWDQEVQADMRRLGQLASADNYPTSIVDRFGVTLRFLPVPTEHDFRVEITEADRSSLNDAIREAENAVVQYLYQEMQKPVVQLVNRLNEYTGGKGQRWHSTLVDNVMELAERLPKLNINKDPSIDALLAELQLALRPYAANPEALKEDPISRREARAKMEDILRRMGGSV